MYLYDDAGEPYNAETFDHMKYLSEKVTDDRLLKTSKGRRLLTRLDPMLFALVYCRDVISDSEGNISFSDLHLELCRTALGWIQDSGPKENRHVFVAPRGVGKSSWAFKLLPMWAAAHGHRKFITAFSHSATQAQTHLLGFKRILDGNQLIQKDFPELCEPMRKANGNTISDTNEMYYASNGFTIAAKGLDSGVLGLVNPENLRPDCILLDDIEPDEANYSPYKAAQRLTTVLDTVFPMNWNAHLMFVGTVTMADSIVHQLVKSVVFPEEYHAEWIKFERFKVHYMKPIVTRDDGSRRSIWPGKWPLPFLQEQEGSRSYKKNFLNLPVAEGEEFWDDADFIYAELPEAPRVLLQIDPAVTAKRTSDFTAFAVVAYMPSTLEPDENGNPRQYPARCEVRDIIAVKQPPEKLRDTALRFLERYPEIGAIRIEVNQGGDTWKSIFKDLPVRLMVHRESIPKKQRAVNLLNYYQSKRVYHRKRFNSLEDQMKSFPNVHNDDLIDAVGAGVHFFLKPKVKMGVASKKYT